MEHVFGILRPDCVHRAKGDPVEALDDYEDTSAPETHQLADGIREVLQAMNDGGLVRYMG